MTAGPTIVNVLTGFLGAGKTTLLRRLLASPELSGAAVLINEVGAVGLDHLLLERMDEDVVLLKSGCVCCTIRGDLKAALLDLHARRADGRLPRFDRVVVETTGLADPAPIVATLAADPTLRHAFRIGAIVAVVDGVLGAATLDAHGEATRQAAVADRIVLSKADLAHPWTLDGLRMRLAILNPTAEILTLDGEAAPSPRLLLDDIDAGDARPREARRWLCEAIPANAPSAHGAIRAFTLTEDQPLDWARFGLWLSMLLNRHGGSILRLKGLLRLDGVATPVAIHGVQHLIHAPVHLDAWPDGRPLTQLVVIASDIDPVAVERSFRAFNRPRRAETA